jgi:hypothetical protein
MVEVIVSDKYQFLKDARLLHHWFFFMPCTIMMKPERISPGLNQLAPKLFVATITIRIAQG